MLDYMWFLMIGEIMLVDVCGKRLKMSFGILDAISNAWNLLSLTAHMLKINMLLMQYYESL